MKKTILITFSFLIFNFSFLISAPVGATTPTPPPAGGTSETKEIISDLKDRIASRVAQLKLVERRGVFGVVSETSGTQITLTDTKNNIRFVDVDELTKFASPSAKDSFGISDITKGTKIGALGLYNKQSRRILARFVDVIVAPIAIYGAVSKVNEEEFSITVVSEGGKTTIADVENITKTVSHTKTTGLIRSGFTKITVGQRIIVVGFPNIDDKTRLTASRIIIFPETPKNPKITISEMVEEEEIVSSTGSGKKLTPITR